MVGSSENIWIYAKEMTQDHTVPESPTVWLEGWDFESLDVSQPNLQGGEGAEV